MMMFIAGAIVFVCGALFGVAFYCAGAKGVEKRE